MRIFRGMVDKPTDEEIAEAALFNLRLYQIKGDSGLPSTLHFKWTLIDANGFVCQVNHRSVDMIHATPRAALDYYIRLAEGSVPTK